MDDNKLVEFLLDNNIHFTERDNAVTLICPRCQKNKLDIRKDEKNWICYYCSDQSDQKMRGWNCSSILSEISGIPFEIVKRRLSGNDIDFNLNKFLEEQKPKEIITPEHVEVFFPEDYYSIATNISAPGVKYLESRGISFEQANYLKIRYSPLYRQISFPVYIRGMMLVGYQGRSIDGPGKYNLPGFKKGHYLMFEQTINSDSVILAEGPVSAMKFKDCGIGYVASMGKFVTQHQMDRLKELGIKNIYLGLDNDAWAETEKLIERHMNEFNFFLLEVPNNRDDYGECTYAEAVEVYKNAQDINGYNWDLIKAERILKGL